MFTENTEELAQNKLLLLYIIKMSPYTFTDNEITEFVLDRNYMNYFSIKQYLLELVESKFIKMVKTEKDKEYHILEKGEEALTYFENKIPQKVKDQLSKDFKFQQIIKKKETQVVADYFEKEDGQYTVNLKLVENDDNLFSLYLTVGSLSQAEIICKSWKNKTEEIYQSIINMLII